MYIVCGQCVFYAAFCLCVCIFFLCATILVNKDVYINVRQFLYHIDNDENYDDDDDDDDDDVDKVGNFKKKYKGTTSTMLDKF